MLDRSDGVGFCGDIGGSDRDGKTDRDVEVINGEIRSADAGEKLSMVAEAHADHFCGRVCRDESGEIPCRSGTGKNDPGNRRAEGCGQERSG